MLERQGTHISLICDSCDEPLDLQFDEEEFSSMVEHAKTEG